MSVFFTAAVCVYNTEKYLRDCLDSILSQSYENIELLIIDDGSTDGSGKVCDEYAEKDSRVRVIHTENRGLLLARRTAFENARGDYFIFFDSDDTVDPKIFTLINEEIQKSHCDMVFFDLSKCYSDGTSAREKLFDERKTFDKSNKRELWELLLSSRFNSLCLKCIRRSAFAYTFDTEFYRGYSRGEDKLLSAHMISRLSSFSYLPISLYNYNIFASQMTKTYSYNDLRLTSCANAEIRSLIRSDGCYDEKAEDLLCCLSRYIYRSFLYPTATALPKKEALKLIRQSEELELFKLCTDRRADKYSSQASNIKFLLLRHKMYSLLIFLTKLKNKA